MANIDISQPLIECLKQFKGAPEHGDLDSRQKALEADFALLAKKLLYGGHLICGNYEIEIKLVEFYYHEEKEMGIEPRILDPIVYHRNGRYPGETVDSFPIMSLHAHTSGYDITFEDPKNRYRASALIRAFAVKDTSTNMYIKWKSKDGGEGSFELLDHPFYDDRSQYLYYYLNGFQINGNGNQIIWVDNKDFNPDNAYPIFRGHRKNVYNQDENGVIKVDENHNISLDEEKEWAFSRKDNTEITHKREAKKKKDGSIISNAFSQKERYGLNGGEYI